MAYMLYNCWHSLAERTQNKEILFMKHKIGFRLDWLEMVFILIMVFAAGTFVSSQMDDKFIYVGLLIIGVGGILIKKRVKMPLKGKNVE